MTGFIYTEKGEETGSVYMPQNIRMQKRLFSYFEIGKLVQALIFGSFFFLPMYKFLGRFDILPVYMQMLFAFIFALIPGIFGYIGIMDYPLFTAITIIAKWYFNKSRYVYDNKTELLVRSPIQDRDTRYPLVNKILDRQETREIRQRKKEENQNINYQVITDARITSLVVKPTKNKGKKNPVQEPQILSLPQPRAKAARATSVNNISIESGNHAAYRTGNGSSVIILKSNRSFANNPEGEQSQ